MAKDGQIITFYSYKGGTGRTMSVANTACLLARRLVGGAPITTDIRVLAIDWDFEAPGLHRYFLPYFSPATCSTLDQTPGCIDLLSEFRVDHYAKFEKDSFRNRSTAKSLLKAMDFNRYLIATTIPGLAIVKSGRHDSEYARAVNAFDWEEFFYSTEGFFLGLADFLRENYDYVLIDSRTGVTDTSGICTTLLPDKLVVPFTANQQSLSGIEDVVRRAVNYRRQSEDWRSLSIFPLPSRIDISRPKLAELWRNGVPGGEAATEAPAAGVGTVGYQAVFERLLAELFGSESGKLGTYFDEVVLQHVPDYAYGEPIAVELEATDSRIFVRRSYEAFVDRLTELSGPWESLEGARKERELAALMGEARARVDNARESKDPKAAEDLLRLGFRIVEGDTCAANAEEMISEALAIAEFAIRANPSAATLLATSTLDHAARLWEHDWRSYGAVIQRAATLFDAAGIFEKAELYRRQHLELLQRHLKADDLATIAAMEQLSLTLQARSNLQEALSLQERVVEAKRHVLGDEDPNVLASMNVLAATLQSLGEVDRARRLRERVEELSRRARAGRPADAPVVGSRLAPRTLRVFISSPADVNPERERVSRALDRLNTEFASVRLDTVRWELEVYSAHLGFQAQFARPSETDIAVFIFWTRAGAPLPPEFVRPDGTTYISSVEYELEDALRGYLANGRPYVLVYRKTAKIFAENDNIEQRNADRQALEALWTRQFRSESGNFEKAYSTFSSTDEFEHLIEQHIRKLVEKQIGVHTGVVWPTATKGSPFRGLAPFYEEHAPVFFGRDRQVEQMRARLIELHARRCPFLLLLGAPGSGKTSLIRAGLVPRLLAPGAVPDVDFWRHAVVIRVRELRSSAVLHFARVMLENLPELAEGDRAGSPELLARLIESHPLDVVQVVRAALAHADARQRPRQASDRDPILRLLIVVDQLEEICGLRPNERDHLVSVIESLVRNGVAWVAAAMRSDAYGSLLTASPALVRLKDDGGQFDLLPPRPADIGEIIRGPAQAAGLSFEEDEATGERVDERLEIDASGPGALPLLEFTLELLYQRRGQDNQISLASYLAIDGLQGAIALVADEVYASVTEAAQRSLPTLLLALANYDDDGRIRLRDADLAGAAATSAQRELVEALESRRLLSRSAEVDADEPRSTVRCG
jgi:cellulose biosynthesis protein BcsQ